jgi:hypothetical protein
MEAPDYFVGGYYGAGVHGGIDQFSPEKRHGHGGGVDQKPCETFAIDDLLDFSNADAIMSDGFFDNVAGNSTDSSNVTALLPLIAVTRQAPVEIIALEAQLFHMASPVMFNSTVNSVFR